MPTRILRDWTDSLRVSALSPEAERFFTRLIMKADDFGRFHGHPSLLRASLFPLHLAAVLEVDIKQWREECVTADLLTVYVADGREYLQIREYGQRTKPGQKSKFPDLPGSSGKIPENPVRVRAHSESESESYVGGVVADAPLAHDAEIPTAAEVIAFGRNQHPPIPEDYCQHQYGKHSEEHRWITPQGRLLDWRRRFNRYWSQDRPTWTHRGLNGKPQKKDPNI